MDDVTSSGEPAGVAAEALYAYYPVFRAPPGVRRMDAATRDRAAHEFEMVLKELAEAFVEFAPELEARTQALRECVGRLGPIDSQVIDLRYERSLNSGQIATELKLSSVNVRVLLNRARSLLRDCVERKLKTNATAF